jgi:ABC-type glycerol-3-phosphate transport system permease component
MNIKKLRKIIRIGFVTFFIVLFAGPYLLIINRHLEFKEKALKVEKFCFGVWLVGIIMVFISSNFNNHIQDRIGYIFFTSIFICFIAATIYMFFQFWRKRFKERWDKEL